MCPNVIAILITNAVRTADANSNPNLAVIAERNAVAHKKSADTMINLLHLLHRQIAHPHLFRLI